MVRHNVQSSIELNQFLDHIRARADDVLAGEANYALTGKNLMVNAAAESLISGQISSLLLILAIIFVLFSVLYTSVLAGLLSLVPNVIPVLLNFGLMGILGVAVESRYGHGGGDRHWRRG